MPGLPVAQVVSVDYEPGLARYDVLCPYCNRVHHHRWFGTDTRFAVMAPCSNSAQRYRVNMPSAPPTKRNGRDDNAIHEYENNWIE